MYATRFVAYTVARQIRTTINFSLAGTQAVAMYAAFAGAAISLGALLIVALLMSFMVFRRAQRYPARTSSQELGLDTIMAVTFGFVSQAVIGAFAPSLAVSSELMVRGAVMTPLALCLLQIIFPDQGSGPRNLQERSDDAYRQTFSMNILWLIAFASIILTNTELMPPGVQGRDFLMTAGPLTLFIVIFRLQSGGLSPVPAETHRRDRLRWMCSRLWGSDKSRSWLWYRWAEIVIFAPLGLTLIWAIWTGFSSGAADADWFHIGANTGAYVTQILISIYVRSENRKALEILREESDALGRERLTAQSGG